MAEFLGKLVKNRRLSDFPGSAYFLVPDQDHFTA